MTCNSVQVSYPMIFSLLAVSNDGGHHVYRQLPSRMKTFLALFTAATLAACSGSDVDSTGSAEGRLTGAGITADDFHTGILDSGTWQIVDPQGDSTVELVGAGTPDAQLLLSVPAGTTHDAWSNNTTLRVMQPAADDDFEIEVKFESGPTQRYQSQGLLVQQNASSYVRFDVFSDGSSLRAFAATFANGTPTVRVNNSITGGPTTYLRLGRSGNQWTARYSSDGVSWTTATSFSHALTVSSVGVFAGNFTPNPAYTAVVDYFVETSTPIASEDPPLCDPGDALLLTTQAVNGTVVRNPAQSSYSCGDVVTLTAQPDAGATFVGWSGALSGTANPASVTINADTTVTANFVLDTTAPQVSNINVTAGNTSAVLSWQTNELSVGTVEYGPTISYELGSVASTTLSTVHAVTLPNLLEGEVYHYRITAEDSLGNSATGADATFTTTTSGGGTGGSTGTGGTGGTGGGANPATILSDDFHTGILDSGTWQVVDPQGNSTVELVGAGTPDAQLLLSVPAGTTHDAWSNNTTLRVMQPAANEDFEIEVKFESEPTQRYQSQGLLVQQNASSYVRFDVFSDGSSLRAFAATFANGTPTVRVNNSITGGPTTYLRLGRSGNQWTARYSYDGVSWTTATSFSHTMTVSSVGVFSGNFTPNPAYTAVVDYFVETSTPIASEDPPLCDPSDTLVLTTQAVNGSIVRNPAQSSYSCGDVVTLTAQPDAGATFVGWSGALSGTANPASVTINADTTVTANFVLDTTAPQVSNVNVTAGNTSAVLSWQTNELSVGVVEYGLTTSYELGSVASTDAIDSARGDAARSARRTDPSLPHHSGGQPRQQRNRR